MKKIFNLRANWLAYKYGIIGVNPIKKELEKMGWTVIVDEKSNEKSCTDAQSDVLEQKALSDLYSIISRVERVGYFTAQYQIG
jgi:hypothetical protein